MVEFKKANKAKSKLRLALIGVAGSGKTYSALAIAKHLGKKIAVMDTEHGSASKYAGEFAFDVIEPDSFHPQTYIDVIKSAEAAGYDVLIIDSLSHAWMGKDGALELVDRAAKRSQSNNTFVAWRDVTPLHNQLVESMIQSRLHLIVTMRAKTEYVMEQNEKGKTVPKRVGIAPVQRDGLEYEFDVVADLDNDNNFMVTKTRCSSLKDAVINKAGKQLADTLKKWLSDGVEAPVKTAMSEEKTAVAEAVKRTEKILDKIQDELVKSTPKLAADVQAVIDGKPLPDARAMLKAIDGIEMFGSIEELKEYWTNNKDIILSMKSAKEITEAVTKAKATLIAKHNKQVAA